MRSHGKSSIYIYIFIFICVCVFFFSLSLSLSITREEVQEFEVDDPPPREEVRF